MGHVLGEFNQICGEGSSLKMEYYFLQVGIYLFCWKFVCTPPQINFRFEQETPASYGFGPFDPEINLLLCTDKQNKMELYGLP